MTKLPKHLVSYQHSDRKLATGFISERVKKAVSYWSQNLLYVKETFISSSVSCELTCPPLIRFLSVQFGGSQSKPEFTVDLRGGSVEWASKDKSSKKHVMEVGRCTAEKSHFESFARRNESRRR